MSVTIKNVSNVKRIKKALNQLGKEEIKVGLFGSDDSEIVMIGAVHEFGVDIPVTNKMRGWFAYNGYPLKATTTVITIPERSWLRTGFDKYVDDIADKIEDLLSDVLENEVNIDVFMDAIGMEFAGMIQKHLRSIDSPPNSEMTVERKKSSNPLIDSGRLVGSIRHEVT